MSDRGNALFIILVTIVLLGMLTYTVVSTSDILDQNTDSQNAYMQASEILRHAGDIDRAIEKVMLVNNCTLAEISFDHEDREDFDTTGYYQNTLSRPDNSCHIFDNAGGGAAYQVPPQSAGVEGGTEYNFHSNLEVSEVGANGQSDLIMTTFVNQDVCYHINGILDGENPSGNPPDFSAAASLNVPANADESYPDRLPNSDGFNAPSFTIGGDGAGEAVVLKGRPTGCFLASNSLGKYIFYHVVVSR